MIQTFLLQKQTPLKASTYNFLKVLEKRYFDHRHVSVLCLIKCLFIQLSDQRCK